MLFSELILDVEHLEVFSSQAAAEKGRTKKVETSRTTPTSTPMPTPTPTPMPTSPMIRIERSATEADEPVVPVAVVTDAKFDPKGKSVASGKSITGWL